jgi:long-chain fatty acid transport protein
MRIRTGLAAALFILSAGASAFGNGLSLNGLGSRAQTMGGAYVALASDFSSIFWNPAGLAWTTGKTFGFCAADVLPRGTYTYEPAIDAKTLVKNYLTGMAAYAQPVSPRLVVGIGIFAPSGLGIAWDGAALAALSGGSTLMEWSNKIGLVTLAPSAAYRISDKLSVGASLNLSLGSMALSTYAGSYAGVDLDQYSETASGFGLGATFGVQYQPLPMLRLGLVYRTASRIRMSGQAEISILEYMGLPAVSDVERTFTWPGWLAGGLAFMPNDRLTVSADVHYTNWAKVQSLDASFENSLWAQLMAAAGRDSTPTLWRDAVQVRLGAEYLVSPALAVRGGWYSDPSPVPDETMGLLLAGFDFNALTFGLGYTVKDLSLDFGLEYLIGAKRTIAAGQPDATPGVYGMKALVPTLSAQYRF